MPTKPHRQRTTAVLAAALGTAALQAVPAAAEVPDATPAPRATASHAGADVGTAAATSAPAPRPVVTLAAPVRGTGQTTYRVRSGDTVGHIALRLGVSEASIVQANGLDRRALIRAGQVLVVPGAGSGAAAATSATASTPAGASSSYTVRPGDTLGHVALRTGTTVAALTATNGLDARGSIRAGQTLSVPGAATTSSRGGSSAGSSASAAAAGAYTVRSGDTLSHIAARSGLTLAQLRAVNPGTGDRLQIGQRISLPAATGSTKVASTFAGRTYPAATVAAAQANKDALAARSVPSRDRMRSLVSAAATTRGVDPALALAIAHQESGFDMRAVSPANAVGVMQVIPSSGAWASELAGRRLDLLDPEDNALAGVLILEANLRAAGDEATAVAAYYQGLSSVRKNGLYADTRRYVANVQTLATGFR